MKQDDDTDQDMADGAGEGESEDTGESTLSSYLAEDDLDHH